ncbi:TIGR03943 family putative permease subunit [Microtetraspora niveoalba]|uniref:TIGR03943 family putative permease subunit n=1 Tax=Microtetraspora niveoalba TaxID=46175 RepID=UPI0012FAE4E2|nr:TIGR03943 family protein [Microtetraspora niveoalba]
MSQSLVMVFLGGAVLRITVLSTTYLNYVKPGFHPFLVAAGAVVLALGVIGLIQEWRKPRFTIPEHARENRAPYQHRTADHDRTGHRGYDAQDSPGHFSHGEGDRGGDARLSHSESTDHGSRDDHEGGPWGHLGYASHRSHLGQGDHESGHGGHEGHDHSRGPRVAWLLCLPVFAIFLISPPALGAFAARSEEPPPRPPVTSDTYAPLGDDTVIAMPIGEFIGRAWADSTYSLSGKRVRLTGFVVPSAKKNRWYVTRIQMNCCAADGIPLKVSVLKAAQPPVDTWVEVTGTWVPPKSDKIPNGTVAPELVATDVIEIPQPVEPYE